MNPQIAAYILKEDIEEGTVKKIALVLLLVIVCALFASADESNLYVKTLYIEQVYPHSLGYRIDYRRPNSMYLATAYLPQRWFDGGPQSLAKVVFQNDASVPFVNLYWRDGEFDHMVLYVHSSYDHISWGTMQQTEDLSSRFDLDEPEFVF